MADSRLYGEDEPGKVATLVHTQARRKGIGTKEWLVVSESGQSQIQVVGKHSIMRRTGLPARDLRVLDPALSYPSTILGRERAIVVSLEHIKAIITAQEVLMVNSSNPLVVDFAKDLQQRICDSIGAYHQAMENKEADVDGWTGVTSSSHGLMNQSTDKNGDELSNSQSALKDQMKSGSSGSSPTGPKLLPFEFRALEACLESACKCLEIETHTLEQEAYPALDELTAHISTLNLERVRQIKSRLVALSGRVQKVRDELEHLLDDDNDMYEMYLTEKLNIRSMDCTSVREEPYDNASDVDDASRSEEANSERESSFTGSKPNVEELEMLLEAYFAQVDGIQQKLSTMSEYVGDTEDYINIMLDDKQNQLLQMGVMLSTAIMIINAGIVVVGLFGMNIHISLFDGQPRQFWATTFGTVGGCVLLYIIAFGWGKKKFAF